METTDQFAVATAENPIVVASNANSGPTSENVTVLLEPNSTSTATATVPVSPARPQFPPSGTLVVVQGVVHTSDVQMPTETSAPLLSQTQNHNPNPTPPSSVIAEAPQTTDDFRTVQRVPSSVSSGPRGRLSALLRRTHRSPSSSRARSVSSAFDSSSTHSANEASTDIRQSTVDAADVQSSTLYPSSPSPPVIQRGNPSGTISSSSIDVLGTLLSVAAAATAASLLTGSSDSTSSTGLAHPSLVTTGTPSSTSIPSADTPALDVPSSLAFSSPYPSTSRRPLSTQINTTNTESVGARDRAERISQLWSAVRSRLGIGHGQPNSQRTDPDSQLFTNPFGSDASANAATVDARDGPGAGPVMDAHSARERMLNEISRAFNLGFSSPSSSAPPTNFTTDAGDTSQGPTFGRAEDGNSDLGLPSEGTFERFLLDLQVDLRNVLTGEGDGRTTREHGEPAILETDNSVTSRDERLPRPLREPEPEDDTAEDSIPSLHDVSDSDDDTESNNSQGSSLDSFASVSPADEAAQHPFNVSESPNDPSIPRPRINYWRLHRFPPIPAARAHAAADNVAQNMRSGLGGLTRAATLASTPTSRSVTSTPAGEDSGTGATPSLSRDSVVQDSPNTGSANVVVPVIIVGLQSSSRQCDQVYPYPDYWYNAARHWLFCLLVNLSSPRDIIGIPIPSPDSRTFLIYVIGGYYPPDHEIVTGTGENGVLDSSFEALLLLNELLHRAPFETPITVTKEQLIKSGLEIINGGQMQEWVKAGKVRSNCVEQCLICLEEYDKQDSIGGYSRVETAALPVGVRVYRKGAKPDRHECQ
ncbi:ring finger protein [Lentinula edodes]|uniref:Ring finger protein n=1 Tax=Lentinula edodes TaxID=5353 RepID=A0A1Q3E1A2_LENED|nr:ring finger protein [Lentinula edodes]